MSSDQGYTEEPTEVHTEEPTEAHSEEPKEEPNEELAEEPTEELTQEPGGAAKFGSYKAVCAKLGWVMTVYFFCRILNVLTSRWFSGYVAGATNSTAAYALSLLVTVILVYITPMIFTAVIFKSFSFYRDSGGLRPLYKKPKRLARALGTFPALYGLGVGTLILTFLASYLITRISGGQIRIQDILRPTAVQPATDLVGALLMVFLLVVIAPVFEEIWVRGVMFDALKPYGNGIAIIISAVLFGLMHGSVRTLFYTTALGFALGYVRYATGSLFVVTALHALFNSVAAGLLFIATMTEQANYGSALLNTVFYGYILAYCIFIVVGITAFIMRLPIIKKYKIENEWPEIGGRKKTALFFVSLPVIIMLVFALNEYSGGWFVDLIIK